MLAEVLLVLAVIFTLIYIFHNKIEEFLLDKVFYKKKNKILVEQHIISNDINKIEEFLKTKYKQLTDQQIVMLINKISELKKNK